MNEQIQRLLEEGLFRMGEAVSFSGIKRSTLYKHMDDGALQYVKLGRARLIPKQALIEFVAQYLQGGAK